MKRTALKTADLQRQHFSSLVEEQRFRWQTENPYVSSKEKELLSILLGEERNSRFLEVGCGEGANLANLAGKFRNTFGLDFSRKRVEFCRKNIVNARFGCGDATDLPFRSESFDVVFCRDVLHHVPDMRLVMLEMSRVCKRGGRLVLIEANGKNPIIFLQGMLLKVERGVWRASPQEYLELLSMGQLSCRSITMREPLPLFRILLHYRFGFPRLARQRVVRLLLDLLDGLAARVVPRGRWAYMVIVAGKPG